MGLVEALRKQGDWNGAPAAAARRARALKLDGPQSPWLYDLLGIIYDHIGRSRDAGEAFVLAPKLSPDIPEARQYLK